MKRVGLISLLFLFALRFSACKSQKKDEDNNKSIFNVITSEDVKNTDDMKVNTFHKLRTRISYFGINTDVMRRSKGNNSIKIRFPRLEESEWYWVMGAQIYSLIDSADNNVFPHMVNINPADSSIYIMETIHK